VPRHRLDAPKGMMKTSIATFLHVASRTFSLFLLCITLGMAASLAPSITPCAFRLPPDSLRGSGGAHSHRRPAARGAHDGRLDPVRHPRIRQEPGSRDGPCGRWAPARYRKGAPTFLTLAEHAARPYDVQIILPPAWKTTVTGMPSVPGTPHHYRAPDYETLVELPRCGRQSRCV
jgi:hypothetical protein